MKNRHQVTPFEFNKKVKIPIRELAALINKKTKDRNEKESRDMVLFGYLLEIWAKKPLLLSYIDEGKRGYKGIDFILYTEHEPSKGIPFQLVEYHEKFSGTKNTSTLGDWIIETKFLKGDRNVHLLVGIKNVKIMTLDINQLRKKLQISPFKSITLMARIKEKDLSEGPAILIGLNEYNFIAKIDFINRQISSADSKCPYFIGGLDVV